MILNSCHCLWPKKVEVYIDIMVEKMKIHNIQYVQDQHHYAKWKLFCDKQIPETSLNRKWISFSWKNLLIPVGIPNSACIRILTFDNSQPMRSFGDSFLILCSIGILGRTQTITFALLLFWRQTLIPGFHQFISKGLSNFKMQTQFKAYR